MTVPDLDRRPTVLIFADHYLPGFKAGGPIRTINNLIEALGDTFRLLVFTRDRDAATPEASFAFSISKYLSTEVELDRRDSLFFVLIRFMS